MVSIGPGPSGQTVTVPTILDDLDARALIHDSTDRDVLAERLERPITVYCGFDPTADSLHVGNLVPLLLLRRFQEHGHTPIALAGGATGMVGDPSGRSDERNLLDQATLDRNLAAIRAQLEAFLDFARSQRPARLVDNRDWTAPVSVLEFLRDVGKHITVNQMLAKESVRARVQSEHGISFTEFSYMLLQANDFRWLFEHEDCELQVGGSDQWGNITAGIDLIHKALGARAFGLTVPLITRSDGAKFGKTAAGAVWLDADRSSPYELYQYFVNVPDADAAAASAEFTAASASLSETQLAALVGEIPTTEIARDRLEGMPLVDLLVEVDLASSKSDARRTVDQGGAYVNDEAVPTLRAVGAGDLLHGRYLMLRRGKKRRHLVIAT